MCQVALSRRGSRSSLGAPLGLLRSSSAQGMRADDATVERRKQCFTCGHRWLDKWNKDECPRCLQPLSMAEFQRAKRLPGEVSTFKQPPGSAMESSSGHCPSGFPSLGDT